MKILALRTRHSWVAVHDVDERGSLCVLDVLERRDVPVLFKVIVRQPAVIELAVALDVALRVHRGPVHRSGPRRNRLEARGVGEYPVRPVTTRAPSHRA